MKKLFSRFVIYAAVVTVLYLGYLSFISSILNRDQLYKIPENKTVMVIGDSHTAYSINDSSLDHVVNLSQPADVYLYTYHKLKKILPLNPQIRTVVISCGGHSIEQFMSKVFLKRFEFTKAKVQNYYHLLSPGELAYLFGQNPDEVIKGVVGLPRLKTTYALQILRSGKISMEDLKIGGFEAECDTLNIEKEFASLEEQKREHEDLLSFWPWQIGYLHKSVDYCRSLNVKVIFLRTPEHKLYDREIEPLFQNFLREQFSDVPFVDYLKSDLPDSCFFDLDHLNYKGSKVFTDTFRHFAATIK